MAPPIVIFDVLPLEITSIVINFIPDVCLDSVTRSSHLWDLLQPLRNFVTAFPEVWFLYERSLHRARKKLDHEKSGYDEFDVDELAVWQKKDTALMLAELNFSIQKREARMKK